MNSKVRYRLLSVRRGEKPTGPPCRTPDDRLQPQPHKGRLPRRRRGRSALVPMFNNRPEHVSPRAVRTTEAARLSWRSLIQCLNAGMRGQRPAQAQWARAGIRTAMHKRKELFARATIHRVPAGRRIESALAIDLPIACGLTLDRAAVGRNRAASKQRKDHKHYQYTRNPHARIIRPLRRSVKRGHKSDSGDNAVAVGPHLARSASPSAIPLSVWNVCTD